MSDRMNQKRRRAYEEKEKKFMENHKRNKETKHLYAEKTDCLLVWAETGVELEMEIRVTE